MKKYKLIKEYHGSPELGCIFGDDVEDLVKELKLQSVKYWDEIIKTKIGT